ncbi:MAG: hypothetical protein F4Z31_02120 [Gemmatimonadetes bacterium]|nr:hypothetical protein [Gemmatimonadota bacterium]
MPLPAEGTLLANPQLVALAAAVSVYVAVQVLLAVRYRAVRGVSWYRFWPASPTTDPDSAVAAVAAVQSSARPHMWIVRCGVEPGGEPRIYLGIRGVGRHDAIAEELAGAAGCTAELLTAAPAAGLPRGGRWVMSQTSGEIGEEPPLGTAARFADHCRQILSPEEAAVIHLRPRRKAGGMIDAVLATSSRQLATSWTALATNTQVRRCDCRGVYLALAGAATLAAGAALAAAFGVGPEPYGGPRVAIVAAAVVTLLVARSLWWEVRAPAWIRRLRREAVFFMPRRALGPPLPPGDVAHWLSGGSQTRQSAPRIPAPEELTVPSDGAIRLGQDPLGSGVYLSRDDRRYGTFVQGSPGTGKTTVLLHAVSEDIRARMAGDPRGVFWLETKGEGVDRFVGVVESSRASHIQIDALGVGGEQRLDLVNWQDPRQSGALLTAACEYAFGTEAIRDHSRAVLNAALECAVALPEAACQLLGWNHGRPNVITAAWWLLGGGAAAGHPERARKVVEDFCPAPYGVLFGYLPRTGVSQAESEKNCKAPRNKLEALLPAQGIFEPDERAPITFDQLLSSHEIVLFNMSPDDGSSGYGSTAAAQLASLIMYCLGEAIKKTCGTWTADGRATAIYSDELGTIAGFGEGATGIIEEIADQGRSRGVWAMFATQDPTQIHYSARRGVTAFGSHICYRMREVDAAATAAASIGRISAGFTPEAIQHLPNGDGVAVLSKGSIPQDPFVLRAPEI